MSFSPLTTLGILENQNYIINSDFNSFPFASNATFGWSLRNGGTPDATSKLPTSAPTGSPAGTLALAAASGGSQISGTVSARLSSTAATTAGDMLITDALALDAKVRSTVLSFSFSYSVTSNGTGTPNFSGTSANAIGVAIYDVTNAAWIQPAGVFNLVQSSGVGRSTGTFQVPSNCSSVRLAVYFPNSTAASGGSPFTVIFDDFVLSPQAIPTGAAISDWQNYTPGTISGFSSPPTVSTARYRRVGSNIEVQLVFTFNSISNDYIRFPGPTGFTIDSSNSATSGTAVYYVGDTETYSGTIVQDSAGRFLVADADGSSWWSGALNSPRVTASGHRILATFSYPVVGLSSNTVLSQDTDTRVVAFHAAGTSTQSIAAGPTVLITGWSPTVDTHAQWSSGSQRYVIPVSGNYRVKFSALFNSTAVSASGAIQLLIRVDGVTTINEIIPGGPLAASLRGGTGSGIINLRAGQYIDFAIYQDTGTTLTLAGVGFNVSIERLSGPATIAASETVAMRAYKTTGSHTSSGSWQTVSSYNSSPYDTHGAFNVTTGVYTVPVSGTYQVSTQMGLLTNSVGQRGVRVDLDGSPAFGGSFTDPTTGAGSLLVAAGLIKAVAGQLINVTSYQNSGGSLNYETSLNLNHFSIVRVGN